MENYTSDSSDSDHQSKTLDLSRLNQTETEIDNSLENTRKVHDIEILFLNNNKFRSLPQRVGKFDCLRVLDVSFTGITEIPILPFPLVKLIAKNNRLRNESLPKLLPPTIKELNFSGNSFQYFPEQIFDMTGLKYLYLGGNQIGNVPKDIGRLTSLQILSMGGNRLTDVPSTLGELRLLQALVLCENEIEYLPPSFGNLHHLKSLLLHKNRLRTLPPNIIALRNLTELSLRDNPLVVRFVSDMTYNPATLMELAARVVKVSEVAFTPQDVPKSLISYLNSGHCCVNPKCKGVYFDNRVEHIKFVDFCGKYRIPLLQYLCSSKCIAGTHEASSSFSNRLPNRQMLRKVLLG